MEEKFNLELLPDAVDFLNKLEEKARDKIYYNIRKSQFKTDNNLLKSLAEIFGNLEFYIISKLTAIRFLGQDRRQTDALSFSRTVLLRKCRRNHRKKWTELKI